MVLGGWLGLVLLILAAAADHAGVLGSRGSDWDEFDRKSFLVTRVADGDTITVRSPSGETRIRLLGVDAPELRSKGSSTPDHWAERSATYARGRSEGKFVTLKLDSTQTRDRYQRLLAYVYLSDTDCLNLALVRDGQAYADRRFNHTYRAQYEMAENEARKKKRGLWKDLTVEQMPAWRREWLKRETQR
jgi:micrococcal nuclease